MSYVNNLDSTNYKFTRFKTDKIRNMVIRRNDLLIKFGQTVIDILFPDEETEIDVFGYVEAKTKYDESPNVRLIGNPNQPTLVFYNKWVVSLFVKNFDVYLSNGFKDGDIITSVDLNDLVNEDEDGVDLVEKVRNNIQDAQVLQGLEQKKLLKIERNSSNIFFSKYDDKGNPYFSTTNPLLFFDNESATKIIKELKNKSINTEYLTII